MIIYLFFSLLVEKNNSRSRRDHPSKHKADTVHGKRIRRIRTKTEHERGGGLDFGTGNRRIQKQSENAGKREGEGEGGERKAGERKGREDEATEGRIFRHGEEERGVDGYDEAEVC